jgi:hypothetical protein
LTVERYNHACRAYRFVPRSGRRPTLCSSSLVPVNMYQDVISTSIYAEQSICNDSFAMIHAHVCVNISKNT